MTAAGLAARLSVSTATVYKMCKSGKWPHSKVGRLYRFTEEHYQSIIATPEPPELTPRNQRENVARLLRAAGPIGSPHDNS
ncbi:helix-turn-helix domain-containing protein [Pseudarthrobacter sp. BIM B-2242]|uniref:helix-turn-helix domain-containing protein n=1 Tax=Pseudarthrobacter sp. BIM B-2242 TaxID=2772401 RepID=UPI001CC6D310